MIESLEILEMDPLLKKVNILRAILEPMLAISIQMPLSLQIHWELLKADTRSFKYFTHYARYLKAREARLTAYR